MPQKEEKKIAPAGAVAKAYWKHLLQYKGYAVTAFISILFIEIAAVGAPLFLRQFVNVIANGVSSEAITAGTWALIGYSIVQVLIWAIWRVEGFAENQLNAHIIVDLSKEAFAYLMHHSYKFFTNSFAGALTRRVNRYSDAFDKLWNSIFGSVLTAILYTLGVISVLWYEHPVLGEALTVSVVFFVALQWVMSRWQQPLRLKRSEEDSNVTAVLADSVANQNNIQLFSGNAYEEQIMDNATNRLFKAYLATWNFDVFVYGLQGLVSVAINLGVLWVAFWLWQQHSLTIGDFVLIQAYIIGLFNNIWSLGREFRNINTALADAGEMVYIMQQPHDIKDAKDAKALSISDRVISFNDVSFSFNNRAVVTHFDLTIPGGQKLALVGPSGAGKTTITRLLLRLYDIKEGTIEIDGQNIAEVTQDSLRDAIAFVPQEPVLFHRSLMDNIRYGKRDATDEEVIEAAKKAHCHEFISALPLGYETFVGERGIKLSGGERQRVAIARAILKNAPILVLDEATSSLDSESEQYIQQALEVLMRGKTVIVIAHRLSTIMKMDRIVVLEGGTIIADGTHEELLHKEGLYKKLWSIQAGGFLKDDEDETITKQEV